MKEVLKGIGSMVMVLLYPCFFMYAQNIGEGDFVEIFEAFGIFTAISAVIFAVSFAYLRNFMNAVFYSQTAMLVWMNFNTILGVIKKWLPETRKAYLFLAVGIIGLALLLGLKKKHPDTKNFVSILGMVFGALILFNFVTAVPGLINKISGEKQTEVADSLTDAVFSRTPNVYYLFYDEYGGFENLKRYYDYDNAEFEVFLQEEEFNISYGSHNTESLMTSTLLPNLFNLSYVASDEEYSVTNFEKIRNCALFQLFTNNGYTINLINHLEQLETEGCNVLNTGKRKETLSTSILNNSIWLEVMQLKEWILKNAVGAETDYARILKSTLKITENAVDKISKHHPTLTVSYICSPHHRFALDEEGRGISSEFELNYENKDFYLGQLKYITKTIEATVKNIKEKDPEALIIIQSDHGMRLPIWMETYHGVAFLEEETERPYMQNILNCVYYQGETIEIEGLSGINTLRKTFNEVLGTEFEMLEPVYIK